jgi:hypothetical protein
VAVKALLAQVTAATVVGHLGGDEVAPLEAQHVVARLDDLARELVPDDVREARVRRVVRVAVLAGTREREVAPADPGVADADEDVVGAGLRPVAFGELHRRVLPDARTVHRRSALAFAFG